ncbi:acyl-CoA reductase [Leuconostoc carnosum]|uniref:Acyl-CoA reductase n=1 Tax=Leuconostoc carnosum TaxID=1252 RepID=A0AAE6IIB2_LEUCA|nr:acyl-CoA reductase [Leuconostoc carnosum]KAA8328356.1 acyl-CoA reductase [Leuconostoc carnosum]QEA32755.1 acyl-CoA reductase [Leuconostoc carnosum]
MTSKQTTIDIFHVPTNITLNTLTETIIGDESHAVVLRYPEISVTDINHIANVLQTNQHDYLEQLTTSQIIDVISQVAEKWTDPTYYLRQVAETAIPITTGYNADQVKMELKRFIRLFRKKELKRFVNSEIGHAGAMLDDFQPNLAGGFSKFFGPDLIFQIFSGNVPGIQLWTLIMGLLVKSPTLGKLSFSEPIMPALFVQTLAEIDSRLADSIAILPWHSGQELEKAGIEVADTVVVCGGEIAVKKVKAQVPLDKKVLSYGYKIGFVIVGREALTPEYYPQTIKKIAEDISIYDQQSCLAPQSIFVERGGAITTDEFSALLATELNNYQIKYSRAILQESEKLAIEKMRQATDIESIENSRTLLFASEDSTSWTVAFHDHLGFSASPLNRSVHVFSIDDFLQLQPILKPYQSYLQTAGVAIAPKRLFALANVLGKLGVSRMSAVGQMNHVSSAWHHDGHFNLLDLVRVTDIENSLEVESEYFDADVE